MPEPQAQPDLPGRSPADRLTPGRRCLIPEEEWHRVLETCDALHQWGSAFLVEEPAGGLVRVYVRDVTGAGRHTCIRLDRTASERARELIAEVEAAAGRAADVVTALQEQGSATVEELRRQEAASGAFVAAAEAAYRELLGPA